MVKSAETPFVQKMLMVTFNLTFLCAESQGKSQSVLQYFFLLILLLQKANLAAKWFGISFWQHFEFMVNVANLFSCYYLLPK